jgi:hypothetical protein
MPASRLGCYLGFNHVAPGDTFVKQPPTFENHGEQPVKNEGGEPKKPANQQTRKPANPSPALEPLDKPEKYTTRLEPSLIKKIRLHAIENDMKDYEVVRTALNQYFERNK